MSYVDGNTPVPRINPAVIQFIKEAGIDIRNQKPSLLTLELLEYADFLVTMGSSEDWGT